jgi:hypothetical protein
MYQGYAKGWAFAHLSGALQFLQTKCPRRCKRQAQRRTEDDAVHVPVIRILCGF